MPRHKALQRSSLIALAVFMSGLVAFARAQTTSHFTDADPSDSFWTTAGNWDSGVPDDQTAAYIGGGNTAAHPTGSAVAQLLTVGHAGVTLPGNGTLNMSGGTLNVDGISLAADAGYTGILNLTGGTITVTGGVTTGAGAGAVYADGGTMTINGDLLIDVLRVGHEGRTASVVVKGADVQIGGGSSSDLIVGQRVAATSTTTGTLNLSEAGGVVINVGTVSLGHNRSTPSGSPTTTGTLTLSGAGANSITADLIRLGQIDGGSTGTTTGTLNLGQNNTINVDTFVVGSDKAVGVVKFSAGGTLTLGGKTGGAANLVIGANNSSGTGTNPTESHFNLAGGTVNATLGSVMIGQYGFGTSGTGSGKGRFTMDAGIVTANSLSLAHSVGTNPGNTTGTLVINGGSFDVTNDVIGGTGVSTIQAHGGAMTIGGDLKVSSLRVGHQGRSATVTAGGDVVINGSGTGLLIGHRLNTTATTAGSVDFSEADSVTINAGTVAVAYNEGTTGGGYGVSGTLTLSEAGTNLITADLLRVGQIDGGATGTTRGTLNLGQNNTIHVDTFTFGGDKAEGVINIAAGGTLTLAGKSGGTTNLVIGANNSSGTSTNPAESHFNLTGGTFNATLGSVVIGQYGFGTSGTGSGKGRFTMDAGTVTANSVLLAHSVGTNPGNTTGTLVINGGSFTVANDVTAGSGTSAISLGGGSFTVDGPVTLGTGTAASTGTINVSGGEMTVAGNVTGGVGTSTVRIDGGTMTVDGDFRIDTLRVGHEGGTAAATVKGTSVQIGNGSGMGLLIGHRLTSGLSATTTGTLDLSAASNVTIDTGTLAVAYTAAASSAGNVSGTLTLSTTGANLITADLVRLGHIDLGATGTVTGTLNLGASNTIHADTFIVGGDKSQGIVTIAAGGTLDLGGKLGGAANLLIGVNNNPTTGQNPAESHLNLAGGTLNATLDSLIIGQYIGNPGAGGSGKGRFTMTDGTVTVNSVLLADSLGSSPANTAGTINLSGGALRAGSIAKGVGQAEFNWTGGRLSVDSFGFDLLQTSTDGPSTLAPGNSIGTTTIGGNYTMDVGTLEIEIAGPGDHDFVMVHGNATLAGSLNVLLLDEYVPALGTHFDVLQTTGNLDISGLALTGDLASTTFGWWDLGAVPSGDGFLLRLSAVPEPSSAILLLLGVAVLLGWRRRK